MQDTADTKMILFFILVVWFLVENRKSAESYKLFVYFFN